MKSYSHFHNLPHPGSSKSQAAWGPLEYLIWEARFSLRSKCIRQLRVNKDQAFWRYFKTFLPLFPLWWLCHYGKHQKVVCTRGTLREERFLDWRDCMEGGWPDRLIPSSHLSHLCWPWWNSWSHSNQNRSWRRVARVAWLGCSTAGLNHAS